MGAVLGTALGRRLAGSSRPKSCSAVFKGAFDGPAVSVCWRGFACSPFELGAVEHLRSGRFPSQVAHEDDGQKAVTSRRVVEGLDRLLTARLAWNPNWLKSSFVHGLVLDLRPTRFMPGSGFPFLRAGPLRLFRLGRRGPVERPFGMDMADEVNVGRQMTEDALAPGEAVAGNEDLIVGKPLGG